MLKLFVLLSLVAASLQEDPHTFATKDFDTVFAECRHGMPEDASSKNPIQVYHYFEFNGRNFPCGIEAQVTRDTKEGSRFPNNHFIKLQMEAMGQRARDEKGHLIGVRFGGPAEWYNLIPMTRALNRNVDRAGTKGWFNEELRLGNSVRNLIRRERQFIIPYKVAVNYDLPNPRPIGIRLKIGDTYDQYFVNEDDIVLKAMSSFW